MCMCTLSHPVLFCRQLNVVIVRFHEQMEQEEKVAKIGTDVIPWQLSEHDKARI